MYLLFKFQKLCLPQDLEARWGNLPIQFNDMKYCQFWMFLSKRLNVPSNMFQATNKENFSPSYILISRQPLRCLWALDLYEGVLDQHVSFPSYKLVLEHSNMVRNFVNFLNYYIWNLLFPSFSLLPSSTRILLLSVICTTLFLSKIWCVLHVLTQGACLFVSATSNNARLLFTLNNMLTRNHHVPSKQK